MRPFLGYLREVFRTGWGILFLSAGAVSTSLTFVLIYRPHFALPYWLPGALSIIAWLIAPYRLYQKQRDQLQNQLLQIDALTQQQQQPRRAKLVLIDESGSYFIRCFTPSGMTPRRETGTYLELRVSIENKGGRPATIIRYDVRIEGVGEFKSVRPVPQTYVLGQHAQHAISPDNIVKSYIEVPAERLASHQHIPFVLDASVPPNAQQIRVEFTVTDSEGNQARAEVFVNNRG